MDSTCELSTTPYTHDTETAYMWGVLEIVIVNIMIRGWWPTNGLEGLLEGQLFINSVGALLGHQLCEFMLVADGHSESVQ
jgi:hypothetical protein